MNEVRAVISETEVVDSTSGMTLVYAQRSNSAIMRTRHRNRYAPVPALIAVIREK